MSGIAVYAAVALVAAAAAFLLAEWIREPGSAAPERPGLIALAAGLIWPVLIVGLAQWGMIAAAHSRLHARPAAAVPARVKSGV